jgi:hypothetical protein
VSYKKQELLTLHEHLGPFLVLGGVRVAHLFCVVLWFCVFFVSVLCLCPVLPVSLNCPFLIALSIFSNFYYIPARREFGVYRDPHVRPSIRHTFGFGIIIQVPLNQVFSNFHTLLCTIKIQVNFDYSVFHIYRSWVMVLFHLENRDFLGFRVIFEVWLNQIFSNFNSMLWTIKYRLNLITVYFTFTVPGLWPFFS